MEKNQRWILLATAFLVCIAITVGGRASPTTIAVDPQEIVDLNPGKSFTVDIEVTDVNDLYGWSINLTYNPTILNVANVTQGSFLQEFGNAIFYPGQTNNVVGFVTIGGILFDPGQGTFPEEGATGSGTVATITFTAEGRGETDLHFQSSKLNTVIENHIVPIAHESTDGLFRNEAPTPLSSDLIIVVVVIVAIAGIAVFFYMRRRT